MSGDLVEFRVKLLRNQIGDREETQDEIMEVLQRAGLPVAVVSVDLEDDDGEVVVAKADAEDLRNIINRTIRESEP